MNTDPTLQRALDQCVAEVLMDKRNAFYGAVMTQLAMRWNSNIETAATDGTSIEWNPDWFLLLPKEARVTVQVHEVRHVACLHNIRRGGRDPSVWNDACDYRINNDLIAEGFSFVGLENALLDLAFPPGMAEEEIYDILIQEPRAKKPNSPLNSDLVEAAPAIEQVLLVSRAAQQVRLLGGNASGNIQLTIDSFLSPIIAWEQVLMSWFADMTLVDYSWRRPNRRYQDMYLPSLTTSSEGLTCLHYYFDVSGSVSDQMIRRFNSEVRYIKDAFNPEKLVLIMFDTEIHEVIEIHQHEGFDKITVTGRGGTDLACVHAHIEATKPTAAIIFTDLECLPMEPLTVNTPIVWTVFGNSNATVPFGKIIHITE